MLTAHSPRTAPASPAFGEDLSKAELPPSRETASSPPPSPAPPAEMPRPKIPEALVRSILYRRRLADALFALELRVLGELRSSGREAFRVRGFVLRDSPAGLTISESPLPDEGQMELDLEFADAVSASPVEKG